MAYEETMKAIAKREAELSAKTGMTASQRAAAKLAKRRAAKRR